MAKVSYDDDALANGETRLVHENGRVLEMSGEQAHGEWWCYENDDMVDVLAEGSYERKGDVDVMMDADGNVLARLHDEDELLAWAEKVMEA